MAKQANGVKLGSAAPMCYHAAVVEENTPPTEASVPDQETDKPAPRPVVNHWHERLPHPHIIALIIAVVIGLGAGAIGAAIGDWASLGYVGVFLVSFVGNASLIFPIPAIAVAFVAGGILDPLLVGVISGAGMALGEITGYLAGYSAGGLVERSRIFIRAHELMQRYGGGAIVVAAAIPNPVFDVVGAVAGATQYPLLKFLFYCFIGKTIKALLLAYSGHFGLDELLRLLHIFRRLAP